MVIRHVCSSQFPVTMIQSRVFVHHSSPSPCYNVCIVCTSQFEVTIIQRLHCLIVTGRPHFDTTSVLCVRHSSPSLWYNVCIVCSSQFAVTMIQRLHCVFVTVRRHYDTTSVVCVCHSPLSLWYNVCIVCLSQSAVTMIQRLCCLFVLILHSLPWPWYNVPLEYYTYLRFNITMQSTLYIRRSFIQSVNSAAILLFMS